MDLIDTVKDGIVRAGREAARVRFIGEAQGRLVALRLARRTRRDALADEVMALYHRHALQHPSLSALCAEIDALDDEIDRIEAALARARGSTAEPRPTAPVVTEITQKADQ